MSLKSLKGDVAGCRASNTLRKLCSSVIWGHSLPAPNTTPPVTLTLCTTSSANTVISAEIPGRVLTGPVGHDQPKPITVAGGMIPFSLCQARVTCPPVVVRDWDWRRERPHRLSGNDEEGSSQREIHVGAELADPTHPLGLPNSTGQCLGESLRDGLRLPRGEMASGILGHQLRQVPLCPVWPAPARA